MELLDSAEHVDKAQERVPKPLELRLGRLDDGDLQIYSMQIGKNRKIESENYTGKTKGIPKIRDQYRNTKYLFKI